MRLWLQQSALHECAQIQGESLRLLSILGQEHSCVLAQQSNGLQILQVVIQVAQRHMCCPVLSCDLVQCFLCASYAVLRSCPLLI
jgi:hypothetical protein